MVRLASVLTRSCKTLGAMVMNENITTLQRAVAGTPELRTDFSKKALIWLLEGTDHLTHDAVVFLPNDRTGPRPSPDLDGQLRDQFLYGVHDMRSSGGTRHIMPFLKDEHVAIGSSWDESGPSVFVFVNAEPIDASVGYGKRRNEAPRRPFDRAAIERVKLPEPL